MPADITPPIAPAYTSTPARVRIVANPGTIDAEALTVFLNPAELTETIQPEWSKLPVVGLDHEVVHYSRTRSIEFPLSFYFSAYEAARRLEAREAVTAVIGTILGGTLGEAVRQTSNDLKAVQASSMNFANFFRSLCFPTQKGLRPPTVRVTWPNVYDILGVVDNLRFAHHKFDQSLTPIIYQADVTFLEVRISRRFSEEVRQFGLIHTEPAEGGR